MAWQAGSSGATCTTACQRGTLVAFGPLLTCNPNQVRDMASKTRFIACLLLTGALLVLSAQPSKAQDDRWMKIKICNESSGRVLMAVAESRVFSSHNFGVHGWYAIEPGTCFPLKDGGYFAEHRTVYVGFAANDSEDRWRQVLTTPERRTSIRASSMRFCVKTDPFGHYERRGEQKACSSGWYPLAFPVEFKNRENYATYLDVEYAIRSLRFGRVLEGEHVAAEREERARQDEEEHQSEENTALWLALAEALERARQDEEEHQKEETRHQLEERKALWLAFTGAFERALHQVVSELDNGFAGIRGEELESSSAPEVTQTTWDSTVPLGTTVPYEGKAAIIKTEFTEHKDLSMTFHTILYKASDKVAESWSGKTPAMLGGNANVGGYVRNPYADHMRLETSISKVLGSGWAHLADQSEHEGKGWEDTWIRCLPDGFLHVLKTAADSDGLEVAAFGADATAATEDLAIYCSE